MAHLPAAFCDQVSKPSRSEWPRLWMAKSMIIVVPPQAAAAVPDSNVSTDHVPPNGISMWVWTSIPPGTTSRPSASMRRSAPLAKLIAISEPGAATATTRSSSTRTSAGTEPVALTTVPPAITVRMASLLLPLRRHQATVRIRTAVTVKGPHPANLFDHVHVALAHDQLVFQVRRHLADKLPTRVDDVGGAVEVVVAERLLADTVDGGDEVLVGDRGGRLLELPEVLREAAARRRGVKDDARPAKAKSTPTLGEMAVVTDVDPDRTDGGLKDRIAEVARPEVVLLPKPGYLRDVVLSVLAEVGAVGINDKGGVVEDSRHLFFVDRDDEDHVQLFGELAHQLRRRAGRHRLRVREVLGVLHLAAVRAVEELLETEDLGALRRGIFRHRDARFDHRLLVARPVVLDETDPHHVSHRLPDLREKSPTHAARLGQVSLRADRRARREQRSRFGRIWSRRWPRTPSAWRARQRSS